MDDRILTFEFVTPCFLGGASREGPAEWRAGSVRGQLRDFEDEHLSRQGFGLTLSGLCP